MGRSKRCLVLDTKVLLGKASPLTPKRAPGKAAISFQSWCKLSAIPPRSLLPHGPEPSTVTCSAPSQGPVLVPSSHEPPPCTHPRGHPLSPDAAPPCLPGPLLAAKPRDAQGEGDLGGRS